MKKLNTKSKVLVVIAIVMVMVMCILAIAIINTLPGSTDFNHKNSSVLFRHSTFDGLSGKSYVDSIYSDGIIEETMEDFLNNKKQKKLKEAKITNEELNKLKELANKVEDQYEENNYLILDVSYSWEIYSERLEKWIILSDESGDNNTETSIEILEFYRELEQKYLEE